MDGQAPVVLYGADGFLGSAIANRLGEESRCYIPVTRHRTLNPDMLAELQPAAIIWFAGSVTPFTASQNPERCEQELQDFSRCLEQFHECVPNSRFLFASSGGSIYSPPSPHAESSAVQPQNAFGMMKLAMEVKARRLDNCTVLRISNVYGPGQKDRRGLGVIAHWLAAAAAGRPLRVYGDAETERDFIYVDDVVHAVAKMLRCDDELPPILNIGSGYPTRLFDLLEDVRDVVDPLPVSVVQHDLRPGVDRHSYHLDVSLAARTIGWTPQTPLDVGIGQTWNHIRPSA